jgi:hypothetical protein
MITSSAQVMNVSEATPRLARTKAALAVYDAGKAERNAFWEAADTNEDIMACITRDIEAEDLVREAFALDTSDVYSRDRAFLVHPDHKWLRKQVTLYGGHEVV